MKTINLALQGGGAHGAFTWGVLDALLEDERLDFEAISGTSAGAMNAVVLADGLMRDGAEGARHRLGAFWRRVSQEGGGSGAAGEVLQSMLGFWHMQSFSPFDFFQQFASLVSPYRTNPLNINPLRDLVDHLIDFDHVRANDGLKLFISATNVRTGKIKVFSGDEVTADAVMASACLPYLFQAVEIGGEAYWDGGYTGNPALFPFFEETDDRGHPGRAGQSGAPRGGAAHGAGDHRAGERDHLQRLAPARIPRHRLRQPADGRAPPRPEALPPQPRCTASTRRQALANYSAATKLDTCWHFFQELHSAGRKAGKDWLAAHYDDSGVKSDAGSQGGVYVRRRPSPRRCTSTWDLSPVARRSKTRRRRRLARWSSCIASHMSRDQVRARSRRTRSSAVVRGGRSPRLDAADAEPAPERRRSRQVPERNKEQQIAARMVERRQLDAGKWRARIEADDGVAAWAMIASFGSRVCRVAAMGIKPAAHLADCLATSAACPAHHAHRDIRRAAQKIRPTRLESTSSITSRGKSSRRSQGSAAAPRRRRSRSP